MPEPKIVRQVHREEVGLLGPIEATFTDYDDGSATRRAITRDPLNPNRLLVRESEYERREGDERLLTSEKWQNLDDNEMAQERENT